MTICLFNVKINNQQFKSHQTRLSIYIMFIFRADDLTMIVYRNDMKNSIKTAIELEVALDKIKEWFNKYFYYTDIRSVFVARKL